MMDSRGGGKCVTSHMAMECVAYNVFVMLLTFNLSLHFSVAMVPVVDLLSSKLTSPSSKLEYCKL